MLSTACSIAFPISGMPPMIRETIEIWIMAGRIDPTDFSSMARWMHITRPAKQTTSATGVVAPCTATTAALKSGDI